MTTFLLALISFLVWWGLSFWFPLWMGLFITVLVCGAMGLWIFRRPS